MQGRRGASKAEANGYHCPAASTISNGINGIRKVDSKNAAVGSYGGTRVSGDREGVTYTKGWTIVTPFLVCVCPIFAMVMTYTIIKLDGQPSKLLQQISKRGFLKLIYKAWVPYMFGSWAAWKYIVSFSVFQLVLMRVLPGKMTKGPVTPAGNTPIYKANGMLAYLTTLAAFFLCAYFQIFNPADIYDHYMEIVGALNIVSLIFCLFLVVKGTYFPSSTDSGNSGSLIFDYYWGTELYPRILGWDIKMFTNCRFGLMSWPLLLFCYAAKQYQTYGISDSMVIAVAIQLVYITKFFHWEMGYMKTLDIMHDRAGFYLCWGCLVWVPSIYTSHTLYLVRHPNNLGMGLALTIFTIGVLATFINYDADRQKEEVRNTQGKCIVWGAPPVIINAKYLTSDGEEKKSILLASGWWGVSRHFHYIPELLAALCWTLPALFHSPLPYFYFVFLFLLLTHRSVRDDWRCLEKYGEYWKLYCSQVPYRIFPFVF